MTNTGRETAGMVAAGIMAGSSIPYVVEFIGGWTKTHWSTRWMWSTLGLKGGTKPHLWCFCMWAVLGLVIFVSSRKEGAHATAYMPLIFFFSSVTVVVAGLKCGEWSISRFEMLCLALAATSFVLTFFVHQTRLALTLSILTDFLIFLPILHSTMQHPWKESRVGWTIGFTGACVNILAFPNPTHPALWTFADTAFPLCTVGCNASIVLITWTYHLRKVSTR